MAESFRYQFAWDPAKAHDNLAKHDIGFEHAATVFRDPLAVTVYDSEHSAAEERWATLGRSESGALLTTKGEPMKPEYDFSKGARGKFYRPDAQFNLPVYLDADVQTYLAAKAAQKGIPLTDLVNQLLQREIKIIESTK